MEDQDVPITVGNDAEGLITYFNLICAARGFGMAPHMVPFARMLTDPRIEKGMGIVGPGSGKSSLISEVYPSFAVGHDPTLTILGISAGEALMQGFQRSVMETIEWDPIYHALFPQVKPDKAGGWSTERGMFVTGREIGNPDASLASAGLESKSLTGKHARIINCDDIHDKENANNIDQCDKVWAIWHNTILGRGDPRGVRYLVTGRRWNAEDIYARHMRSGEFVVLELPAERDGTKQLWVDVTIPDGLICCFNEKGIPDGSEDMGDQDRGKRRRLKLSDAPSPRRPRLKLKDAAA